MTLSANDIQGTAWAAMSALGALELPCCLVGSAACYELGNLRIPNDVDILVLASSKNVEEIKAHLVSLDSNFSLATPEKNPLATYRVLWYTLPHAVSVRYSRSSPRCRVDLFLPGTISLPPIPAEHIIYPPSGLPTMPLLPALMHKVLAWIAHGEASREDKQLNDLKDISGLMAVAETQLDSILAEDKSWYPDWFVRASFRAVVRYVQDFPETARLWQDLEAGMNK